MEPKIHSLSRYDFDAVVRLWEKYYKDEFPFPDFVTNYLLSFTVQDEKGIICAAGVRTLAEVVLMTDLSRDVKTRRKALINVLEVSSYIASTRGYDKIHAFTDDEKWERQLRKSLFRPVIGNALVRDVSEKDLRKAERISNG